ncbi:MAG: DUF3142 domain-containing protein [Puniceicoccaceae bacterium]
MGVRRILAAVFGLASLAGCGEPENAKRPLPQEAYVWQRAWTPAVGGAVRSEAGSFAGLHLLAAEVAWTGENPVVSRPDLPLDTLSGLSVPVSPVLRLGPFDGTFDRGDPTTRFLCDLAVSVVEEWRTAGVRPAELQVDFDAATARLADYRSWVEALREAVAPTPLTITALPTWLPHPAFPALARATDGYVLQVHSFRRPSSVREIPPLCDPEEARRSVRSANRIGVPFRVALPTYGYALFFDGAGNFTRLAAEGFPPESLAAAPATVVRLAADPDEMAGLVREWTRKPPGNLAGLLWFRLPTPEDHWNWPIETLRAVRQGRSPESRLEVRAEKGENGLIRILVENQGETEETLPATVGTRLSPTHLLAGDGSNGYVWSDSDPLSLTRPHPSPTLRPAESRTIAWLRLTDDTNPHPILVHDFVP